MPTKASAATLVWNLIIAVFSSAPEWASAVPVVGPRTKTRNPVVATGLRDCGDGDAACVVTKSRRETYRSHHIAPRVRP
jgi:hypothetical protein